MALDYGDGGGMSVTMDGPFASSGGGGGNLKLVSISAPVANWKGGESPFSQIVRVDGVTTASKVDVQLSIEQTTYFANRITAFQAVNTNGVIALIAYGSMPDVDVMIQATITEVNSEGVILGDIFTVTNPQADYGQTDSTKADFIKNKPDAAIAKAQSTADAAKATAEAALPRTGGTMTGTVDMDGNPFTGLAEPEADTDAASKAYVDSRKKAVSVTLLADKWEENLQTVTVEGVTEDESMTHVLVSPKPQADNYEAYNDAEIRLYAQANNGVTFICETVPTKDISTSVMVFL